MSFPNWPDKVTRKYPHVPLELVQAVKAGAKGIKPISIKSIPMPGKRDTFQLAVTASMHSWAASNDALVEFYTSLPAAVRESLALYRDI